MASKPTPVQSYPDNSCAFNGWSIRPEPLTRGEAAATLRRARHLRGTNQARISVESRGHYRLTTFSTILLSTRAC